MDERTNRDGEGTAMADPVEAVDFHAEAFSRNADLISEHEQGVVHSLRVLVAGCGSVGGAVVEPLARLGVLEFALADPDSYDLSNLNRQACYVADLGRSKAAVLAERVAAINPYAQAAAYEEGLTTDNIPGILDACDVVFDGIDGAMSPWEKYTLHAEAAARRIPVVAGADFGGKPVLYVFDYRHDQRPFYGKGRSEDHREGRFTESVRWLGYRPIPRDFAPIIADRLASGDPWPQIAYCVAGMGAIGSRTVIEVALGRPVRHVVAVDVHDLPRRAGARLAERLRWPATAARTLAAVRRGPRRSAPAPHLPGLPPALRAVLEAARAAPSAHNAQPVRFLVRGRDRLAVDWDRTRALAVADPAGDGVCFGIGCALEAIETVAEVGWSGPSGPDPLAADWFAGEIEIGRVHEDFARRRALLDRRGTTRTSYSSDRVPAASMRKLVAAAERHRAVLVPLQSERGLGELARLTGEAAADQFADPEFLAELLAWMRLSDREERRSPDGFTTAGLDLDPAAVALMRAMRSSAALRRGCGPLGLAKAMGKQAGDGVRQSGAVVLLGTELGNARDRIRAGRALMAVWLAATRERLAVQPVFSALATLDGSASVLDLFGVESPLEAVTLLRLGRAKAPPPPSPRLPLERICVVDRAAWGAGE